MWVSHEAVLAVMQCLPMQNLANLVYGYAVMGVDPGPMLLIAIAKEAQRQLHDFGPQVLIRHECSCMRSCCTVCIQVNCRTSMLCLKPTAHTHRLWYQAQPRAKQCLPSMNRPESSDDW